MKRLLFGIVGVLACARPMLLGEDVAPANDPVPFEIRTIQRATNSQALVENAWKRNAPGIEVTLRVMKPEGSSRAFVNACFYNKDKELVAKFLEPGSYTVRAGETFKKPDFFKPREYYKVFFPLTERVKEGKDRWSHVVIVFGEGRKAIAEIYPKDDITPYEYPAKAFAVVKDR